MIKLLQWLIFGHIHSYGVIRDGKLFEGNQSRPMGEWYIRECTICKKRKYTTI